MKYYFAPLQGYTDAVYREVFEKHFKGMDAYVTPFCRVERGEMRWHDQKDINPERNQGLFSSHRLIPQIIGNTEEEVTLLVDKLHQLGYRAININFGCPFPMIAKKQKGAGILACPDKVENVLSAIKKYPDCSFSVKMRLGMESSSEGMQLLPMLNSAGLSHITIHPRLGKDQYKGEMDLQALDSFQKECKVPLLFNGDIVDQQTMEEVVKRFPNLEGVMIGRGLLMNPFLVEELNGAIIDRTEKAKRLRAFLSDLQEGYSLVMNGGEIQLVQKLASLWEYLLPDVEKRLRKKIMKSRKLSDYNSNVVEALRDYKTSGE